ncbi:hypothetical protein [Planomonospora sp. ID82291]|uniref:hypothetical protein n=1 Tax=Planomonospora sp. ID82291 TaxID=2738136 RepID=UPI0018C3C1B3|nr:hypothetical protein [Planomonospora sp. ID82291]MBG0818340.1 hypothetical protein [Planomonospora sp. ID82291]
MTTRDVPTPPATAAQAMSDAEIDHILQALADACDYLLAAHAEAERSLAALSAEDDQSPMHSSPTGTVRPDPLSSLHNQRTIFAENAEEDYQAATQKFTAWWADVATCAVMAALTRTPLTHARAAAADPGGRMDSEELALIAPIPEAQRQLAELAVRMDHGLSFTPESGSGLPSVSGQEFAERLGLAIKVTPDGQPVLVDDDTPEARRRRLWGEAWLSHKAPLLPTTEEFVHVLTSAEAPSETVDAITEASRAVEAAVAAHVRANELTDQLEQEETGTAEDAQAWAEVNALWQRFDALPQVLAAYARVLTTQLPALRRKRQAN